MAITVTIAGVDRTSKVQWSTLRVQQVLTSQIDSAGFAVKNSPSETYKPSVNDSVVIQDGSTKIFGGTVSRVTTKLMAGGATEHQIECVDHGRTLDRFLVAQEYSSKTAFYIINSIFDDFVNTVKKTLDTGESSETWTQEDGTVAANTTASEIIYGAQSRKFTATAGSTATARINTLLNLTTFDDGSASTTGDYIRLWFHVDDPAKFASLRIICGSDTGATYTNYYSYTYSGTPRTGWNYLRVLKSAFTSTGSPSWATVEKRQYRVTANGSGTVNVSIDDIRMEPSTHFSMQNVTNAVDTIGSAKFNYEQVSQCLKQIAEMLQFDWFVDSEKDLYFFEPTTIPAPFSITSTSNNFVWNSLQVNQDMTALKNVIIVRGGEYQGATITESISADGNQLMFRTPYKMKNVSITVAGVGKTVGVDNLDDPASYDALYNFNEKTLKFKSGTKPSAGQVVAITGNPMLPVIIKKTDATSVASYGVFQHVIVDKSIITLQGARDRASAELQAYREKLVEGTFLTHEAGLKAGQTISVNVTELGVNATYIIRTVDFTAFTHNEFQYFVTLVSTRSYGIIEYLLSLLQKEKKQIVINDSEVVDLVQDLNEEITITDAYVLNQNKQSFSENVNASEVFNNQLNHGTIFVLTPYTPTGFSDTKRPFILSGSPMG